MGGVGGKLSATASWNSHRVSWNSHSVSLNSSSPSSSSSFRGVCGGESPDAAPFGEGVTTPHSTKASRGGVVKSNMLSSLRVGDCGGKEGCVSVSMSSVAQGNACARCCSETRRIPLVDKVKNERV